MKQDCPAVPAFLSKLWTLLEDKSTNDLIRWSPDGCSFMVLDELRFSKDVLPLYFKHSNMPSFVRQLNMYGFHKVVSLDSGGLPKEGEYAQCVEFEHKYFQRSQAHLLSLIRRKVAVSRAAEDTGQITQMSLEVSQIRTWYDSSHLKLLSLCRDNESMWRELDSLQQKYQHQHQIIKKIIRFIVSTVQSNNLRGSKRKLPMIDSAREWSPAPKFRRSSSLQSTYHVTPRDSGVYSNKMLWSDLSHLFRPRLNRTLSVSLEVPSSSYEDPGVSPNVLSSPCSSLGCQEVPCSSTDMKSQSESMISDLVDTFYLTPSIFPSDTEVHSLSMEVPCQPTATLPSPYVDVSNMLSQEPSASTSFVSLSADGRYEVSSVPSVEAVNPSIGTDVSSTLPEDLSCSQNVPILWADQLPLLLSEIPTVAASVPSQSKDLPPVFHYVSLSADGSSEPAEVASVEQVLSLLLEPETQRDTESVMDRCMDDPLALIDSSLAAISSSLAPSIDGLELLSEFFSPAEDTCDTITGREAAQRKQEAPLREDTTVPRNTRFVDKTTLQVGDEDGDEDNADDEDLVEGPDILPSLLQLAQEASALTLPTTDSTATLAHIH